MRKTDRRPNIRTISKALDDFARAVERRTEATTRNVAASATRRKHSDAVRQAEGRVIQVINRIRKVR